MKNHGNEDDTTVQQKAAAEAECSCEKRDCSVRPGPVRELTLQHALQYCHGNLYVTMSESLRGAAMLDRMAWYGEQPAALARSSPCIA